MASARAGQEGDGTLIAAATVFVATFFSAPAEGPLLIPAEPGCSE
jgi:hypothetical protein